MIQRRYRTYRLKDTSNRNLLIRADKRERLLAYSYIRGKFKRIREREFKLDFKRRVNCQVDNIMLELLDEVDWVEYDKEPVKNQQRISYINSDKKTYIRRLMRINHLCKNKGILDLYSPVTFFAFLTAPCTKYIEYKKSHEIRCYLEVKAEDAEEIIIWFKYGSLKEITGNKKYDIKSFLRPYNNPNKKLKEVKTDKITKIVITEDNLVKMFAYISKDKYVGKYLDILIEYINNSKNIRNAPFIDF